MNHKEILKYLLMIIILPFIILSAQENKYTLLLNAGISIPSIPSGFSNNWQTGFTVGIGIGYNTSTYSHIIVQFNYYNNQLDKDSYIERIAGGKSALDAEGGSTSIVTANIMYKPSFNSSGTIIPYLIFGIGLMNISKSNITVSVYSESFLVEGESNVYFSLMGGAGVDIFVSKYLILFAEANYYVGFKEDETVGFIPIRLGLSIKL